MHRRKNTVSECDEISLFQYIFNFHMFVIFLLYVAG